MIAGIAFAIATLGALLLLVLYARIRAVDEVRSLIEASAAGLPIFTRASVFASSGPARSTAPATFSWAAPSSGYFAMKVLKVLELLKKALEEILRWLS